MKYFGIDRVKEPVGTIPSTAWRLDNSRMVGRGEFRVRLKVIKLEGDNFNQICSASDYNEQKVKEKLLTIVSKRGKLQNPYTESSGIICGTIEEIGSECSLQGFKVGDEIISLTSISGIPVYIDSIKKVDYDYGEIWCDGYAIMFEAAQIAHRPDNVDIRPLMCALDEEGSLLDVKDVLSEKKPSNVAIVGSNLVEMILYSQMVNDYDEGNVRLIAVTDRNIGSYIKENEFMKAFKGLVERVYYVDMARPVESFEAICQEEPVSSMDAIINLEDIQGAESIAAMLVKDKGFLFHTGVKRNYFQSLLAIDCLGKEVVNYALDGYAQGGYDFAIELIKKTEDRLKIIDDVLTHRPKKRLKERTMRNISKGLEVHRIDDFIFMSPVTAELVDTALNVAKYDCNVIIQGETGVGKEKILNILHQNSPRKSKPCIKINCATIQENLAESEFFGYEKGSFTGARDQGKAGYFELANNGTLFLDEIGSLPLAMQSKLLRVLQENSYYRVGGTEQKNVNVRVICANNVPLKTLVDRGEFREDLYYRLNICMIDVPPLRRRKEDVICLADAFIKEYSRKYGIEKSFTIGALQRLEEYHWPGNVRELENTVHRLYISEKEDLIDEGAVDSLLNDSIYDNVVIDIRKQFQSRETIDFSAVIEEQEKKLIAYALKKEKTTRKAADFLNLPQATLARKKVKYGL